VITIAIVSYRYGHLIAQAIESVLSQTQLPSHVVIVDDGARDVAPVAQKYLDDFRRRHIGVVLIDREKNLGIVENFNDVLMNAVRTPRVMFLGADNYLRPDALERLSALKEDIVSYDIALFGADSAAFAAEMKTTEVRDGYPIWRFVKGDITRANYIHGSSLYNATLAKRYGYRASGHWYTEEDWMLFRAMLEGGATHAHVAEPLLFYRRHTLNFHAVQGTSRVPRSRPGRRTPRQMYWQVAARLRGAQAHTKSGPRGTS